MTTMTDTERGIVDMEAVAEFAELVGAVAASDQDIIDAANSGMLDDDFLREHMPRLMERALVICARGRQRHTEDPRYRAALSLGIYERIVHKAGLDRIKSLPPYQKDWR